MSQNFKPILEDFPQFGPLQGIRILDTGSVWAGPWAATLAAEFGAEVIKCEAFFGDVARTSPPFFKSEDGKTQTTAWAQDSRNKIDIALNFKDPEVKEIFARMLKESDVWIESSIPGTYPEKFGITDEWVFSINPKIIIVHESGFGQTGDPNYVRRASYDMIGQAFSGFCDLNGFPDGPPMRSGPAVNDYITALWVLWSALAGYIHAQKTGKGQVIDVAQFEVQFRMMECGMMDYLMFGKRRMRSGNYVPTGCHPFGIYQAKDGYISIAAVGGSPLAGVKKTIPEMNIDKYSSFMDQVTYGSEIKDIVEKWLSEKTVEEAEALFVSNGVPCCPIMTFERIAVNPHYEAREMLMEWDDPIGGKIKGIGLTPKFSETPGQIWRGAPTLAQDTDLIMKRFGFSEVEIAELKEKKVIK